MDNSRDQRNARREGGEDAPLVLILDAKEAHEGLAGVLQSYGYDVEYISPATLRNASTKTNTDAYRSADVLLIDAPYARDLIHKLSDAAVQQQAGELPPVIVLTEGGESSVQSLGSVDTMRKPVIVEELVVRIRWLVERSRRNQRKTTQPLESSGITLDRDSRRVLHGDNMVALTRKEFTILSWLVRKEGHAVSRSELFEIIGAEPRSNTVDVHVKNIRQKLDMLRPGLSGRIQSVRGVGYRIQPADEAPGGWDSPPPPASVPEHDDAAPSLRRAYRGSGARRSRSRRNGERRQETPADQKERQRSQQVAGEAKGGT